SRLLWEPRDSWCRLQCFDSIITHIGRQVIEWHVLAKLKRANVRCDCPSVTRRHLLGVISHRAVTVGRDIEEVANWNVSEWHLISAASQLARIVCQVRRWPGKTAPHDLPVSCTSRIMAYR